MKRGILIGICLMLCLGAVQSKYWQDVLAKPNQQWIETYGHNPDSVIAYNVRMLIDAQVAANKEIAVLKASANDPNDPNRYILKICPQCKPGKLPSLLPNQHTVCAGHDPNDLKEK